MKKLIGILMIGLFAVAVFTANIFAGNFDQIYMTDANSSTTPKTTFGFNDTPWLYLKLSSSGLNVSSAWWQSPNANAYYTSGAPTTNQEQWLTLDNWQEIKAPGTWNVNASYFYANNPRNPVGFGSTSFTVTPEPISAALFMLGGSTLAFGLCRKRKKHSA